MVEQVIREEKKRKNLKKEHVENVGFYGRKREMELEMGK